MGAFFYGPRKKKLLFSYFFCKKFCKVNKFVYLCNVIKNKHKKIKTMRNRFEEGLTSQELQDLLDEFADWSCGTYNLIAALEEYFGGEIVETSNGARHAIKIDELLPMPGNKFDGDNEEWHHIAFKVDGDVRVECVPFCSKERINEMGINF